MTQQTQQVVPYDPYDFPDSCPEPTPEPTTGVTLTAQQLAAETTAELDRAVRILAVVSATVTEYAPHAPTALLNEAAIRMGGYLAQSDYGSIRENKVGGLEISYQMNHAMMFRNSGAQALITRWKIRRAGVI